MKQVIMMKSILIVGACWALSCVPELHVRDTEPQGEAVVVEQPAQPQSHWLENYDERVFPIAVILESRRISGSMRKLLDLSQLIVDKSEEIGVEPSLLLALIDVESTFRLCAQSRVGAKGLMQVMPAGILGREQAKAEFAFSNTKVFEPFWNISLGSDYLGRLIKRFGCVEKALTAYNMGPTRLNHLLRNKDYFGSVYANRVLSRVDRFSIEI